MKNYDPLDCSLTPELILRPCIRVIKPDTSPWAVTQSWVPGLELDAAAPSFYPILQHRHPGQGWDQMRKENVCPTIHAPGVYSSSPPSFLEFSLILSLLPQQRVQSTYVVSQILQPSVSFSLEWKGLSPLISKSPLLSISGFSSVPNLGNEFMFFLQSNSPFLWPEPSPLLKSQNSRVRKRVWALELEKQVPTQASPFQVLQS